MTLVAILRLLVIAAVALLSTEARLHQPGALPSPPSVAVDIVYPLMDRRAAQTTQQWTWQELQDNFHLTFNDYSVPKTLNLFILTLSEAAALLPSEPSLSTVATALDTFLTAELNAVYAPTHAVRNTQTIFIQQSLVNSTANAASSKQQQTVLELVTSVNVQFQYEPSPDLNSLDLWVKSIMANLNFFVSNITAAAHGDVHLKNIKSAQRSVYQAGTSTIVGGDVHGPPVGGDGGNTQSPTTNKMQYVIPAVVAGVALLALLAFLALRNKRSAAVMQSSQSYDSIDRSTAPAPFADDHSDIFSLETGLIDSPLVERTNKRSIPQSDADIFSGLDNNTAASQQNGDIRSKLSFLTAFTSFSSRTKAVDNRSGSNILSPTNSGDAIPTPHSRVSSLFAFSEGESDSDDDMSPREAIVELSYSPAAVDEHETKVVEDDNGEGLVDTLMEHSKEEDLFNAPDIPFILNESTTEFLTNTVEEKFDDTQPIDNTTTPLLTYNIPEGKTASVGDSYDPPEISSITGVIGDSPNGKSPVSPLRKGWNLWGRRKQETNRTDDDSQVYNSSHESSQQQMKPKALLQEESVVDLSWSAPGKAVQNAAVAAAFVGAANSTLHEDQRRELEEEEMRSGRHHIKSTAGDGSMSYQNETMAPNPEWTLDTTDSGQNDPILNSGSPKKVMRKPQMSPPNADLLILKEPQSLDDNSSSLLTSNELSQSQPIICGDMLWFGEEKTDQAAKEPALLVDTDATSPKAANESDSLSFVSQDPGANISDNSSALVLDVSGTTPAQQPRLRSIVCRDCCAPPGKLKIIIHSTKDGPAVHTVKPGSSLEGQIFVGDLIISVDNVDTRSYSAEQVMKMMTAKTRFERKITVLHFAEEV
jgi:hypothetical protein